MPAWLSVAREAYIQKRIENVLEERIVDVFKIKQMLTKAKSTILCNDCKILVIKVSTC